MINLSFYGAARTVTGSCFVVDNGVVKIMVDCGLFQGSNQVRERNYGEFPFSPGEIDYLLLTHAHIDHSGLIPKLCRLGFSGPVITTSATFDLCSAMLPDSGHIQESEVERKNRKNNRAGQPLLEPIYTTQDAVDCLQQFQAVSYDQEVRLNAHARACFRNAGHILGSSIIELWVKDGEREIKLVFSGDIGNCEQPIIDDPVSVETADFVVMESTYGNRLHEEKEDKLALLSAAIRETFKRGGNLIIPAFAVERTQDLLYDLNILIDRKEVLPRNIYIDSPLAVTATEIFCRNMPYFDSETRSLADRQGGECPLYLPGLQFSRTLQESMALNQIKGGAIIISASGMCDAGRIKHHLKHNLWRKECTILFVGYQAEGTLGRRLLEGEKKVRIHGEEVAVRAEIRHIDGFSAHADQIGLLAWAKGFRQRPERIFVTHGEEQQSLAFAALLEKELGVSAQVPQFLDRVDLQATGLPATTSLASSLAGKQAVTEEISAIQVREVSARIEQELARISAKAEAGGNQELWLKLQAIEKVLAGS